MLVSTLPGILTRCLRSVAPALALSAALSGCQPKEQVSTYTVPAHESLQTPEYRRELEKRRPIPARMLAAILPQEPSLWFFKLQGPPDEVAGLEPVFRELIQSVKFPSREGPTWTLPAGWTERPGNELRYRTLIPNSKSPLELTVSALPIGDSLNESILANLNRWRNQLDLPFIEAADIPYRTEALKAGDIPVTLLNIVGKARPAAAMPGMAAPGMAMPGPQAGTPGASAPGGSGDIRFQKPDPWMAVAPKQFIQSAFMVVDGKKELLITVSRAGGSAVANVNRWRGQMGLEPLDEPGVAQLLKEFPVGSRPGALLEMATESQALVVALIPAGGSTIFIKMMGDPKLATQERERFEAFARSVTF